MNRVLPATALAAVALIGCDEKKLPAKYEAQLASASAAASAPPPPPVEAKPTRVPDLLVDEMGPFLGSVRIDMSQKEAADKMKKTLEGFPIQGQAVNLTALRKAKSTYVAALVDALGEAGAPTITLRTEGRGQLPKQIVVVPEKRASDAPPCSVTSMVIKDLSTAVWPLRGGLAKAHRKGFAGPDLTVTAETVNKAVAACTSSTLFFSVDESLEWGHAYDLAATIDSMEPKLKIDRLVLLREPPVAGRPVKLAGK